MSDKLRGKEGVKEREREREREREADRQRDRDGGGTAEGVCKKTDKLTYMYMHMHNNYKQKSDTFSLLHTFSVFSPSVKDQTLLQAPQRMSILPNTALKRRAKCLMEWHVCLRAYQSSILLK